mmetsp:Transcript_33039/g.77258  ORF Transcript_33039/g.77258 Transcript_33039/m.77258 type:complete len:153 (+) Transcript_33039:141-599(+)
MRQHIVTSQLAMCMLTGPVARSMSPSIIVQRSTLSFNIRNQLEGLLCDEQCLQTCRHRGSRWWKPHFHKIRGSGRLFELVRRRNLSIFNPFIENFLLIMHVWPIHVLEAIKHVGLLDPQILRTMGQDGLLHTPERLDEVLVRAIGSEPYSQL